MRAELKIRNWLLDQGFEYWAEDDALHCPDNPEGSKIPYEILRLHAKEIWGTLEDARGTKIRQLQATRPEWIQREVKPPKDCGCQRSLTNK